MQKHYNAKETEKRIQKFWEEKKIYKFKNKEPIFSIDTPPPYASAGHLHVGHALSYTQFEMVARIRRMAGFNVYFPPGFDNNGLPTEKYVEEKFNIDKSKTNRSDFRKLCLKEAAKVEKIYADKVFKALGHSYDWDLLYTTISPEAQKISQTVFLKLHKKKDCYRKEEPTLWCTKHQTALAQAEIEDVERTTKLNYIYFELEDKKRIEIATTRPELLPSCVGIFVHPNDKRYSDLIGKKAIVPIFNQKVPIMADGKVDMTFGSGIVMICTFGDTTDIEWWKKHKLPLKICIDKEGKLNELAKRYKGLTLQEGREKILEDLKDKLIKQENLQQAVGTCWRCNTPLEFIVTKQWFIKALDYKKDLLNYGKKINWYPKFMRVRYEDWVKNLNWDWCISRQRFYGVPIPVWYCKKCKKEILPEEKDLPIDPLEKSPKKTCSCGSKEFTPEKDVFDTWMTSSNSPEIASKWLENPSLYQELAPMSLRPQSHDIIRTWAFYTILKSFLLFKRIPWKDIIINTFVLDEHGKGMSKSKGNAIWADDLLEKYNVDSFRYWMSTASLGTDLPFKENDIIAGNRLITKLWNAFKFSLMHLETYKPKKTKLLPFDSWLLSKLNSKTKKTIDFYLNYNIQNGRKTIEKFFWSSFCDNYLEIIKDRIYNGNKEEKASAQYALYTSLLTILKLFAPIMPHITEELYQIYFKKHEKDISIHISEWPKYDKDLKDKKLEKEGDELINIISEVRQFKNKNKKPMKEEIKLTLPGKLKKSKFLKDLASVTNAKKISYGKELKIEF